MAVFRIRVEYADGDDFAARRHRSVIDVEADRGIDARRTAEQMALTPQLGKPQHMQITCTTIVSVVE